MQLAVRVLPTIVCFLDGKAVDRIVGFSEFGARDDFPTWLMAKRLVAAEMIKEAEFEEAWQDDEEAE
jgi:thioredoxin-like negative regulator of GroEL